MFVVYLERIAEDLYMVIGGEDDISPLFKDKLLDIVRRLTEDAKQINGSIQDR